MFYYNRTTTTLVSSSKFSYRTTSRVLSFCELQMKRCFSIYTRLSFARITRIKWVITFEFCMYLLTSVCLHKMEKAKSLLHSRRFLTLVNTLIPSCSLLCGINCSGLINCQKGAVICLIWILYRYQFTEMFHPKAVSLLATTAVKYRFCGCQNCWYIHIYSFF